MSGHLDVGVLQGTLVRLVPLELRHADALVTAAAQGRERYTLTGVPADRAEAEAYIRHATAGRAAGDSVPFAVVDRRTDRVVGSTRFCYIQHWRWPEQHRTRPAEIPDAAEIGGTWLARDAQRTGINREAKLLMLDLAFEQWRLHRIRLRTDARNSRSRAAIEGIGARFDGILRADTSGYDGIIRDSAAYSITAADWPAVRDLLESRLERH